MNSLVHVLACIRYTNQINLKNMVFIMTDIVSDFIFVTEFVTKKCDFCHSCDDL